MDRQQALNRIIELAAKWQQKHEWAAAFKAADRFREYRDKGSDRFDELSDQKHGQVIAAHAEFIEMENLLRQYSPEFLELVPGVNFFTGATEDHSQQIQNVKRLEGSLRAKLQSVAAPVTEERACTIPEAEALPFGLQRCDVPRWLRRAGFDAPVEIPEVYSEVMEALMAAAPNAVTGAKRNHLKACGYDTKNAPKKLRDVIDVIGLAIDGWTLRALET
jgi:hypothetical protein